MRARKCDKCGKFYEHYDGAKANTEKFNAVLFIDRDMENKYWSRNTYDLCEDCALSLINFIKGGQV